MVDNSPPQPQDRQKPAKRRPGREKGALSPNTRTSIHLKHDTIPMVAWYVALGYCRADIAHLLGCSNRTIERFCLTPAFAKELEAFKAELKERVLDYSVNSMRLAELTLQKIMSDPHEITQYKLEAARIVMQGKNKPNLVPPDRDDGLAILRALREAVQLSPPTPSAADDPSAE